MYQPVRIKGYLSLSVSICHLCVFLCARLLRRNFQPGRARFENAPLLEFLSLSFFSFFEPQIVPLPSCPRHYPFDLRDSESFPLKRTYRPLESYRLLGFSLKFESFLHFAVFTRYYTRPLFKENYRYIFE